MIYEKTDLGTDRSPLRLCGRKGCDPVATGTLLCADDGTDGADRLRCDGSRSCADCLVLAGNRNLERARLLGYAKQACAPESDRKRLSRQLVSEALILILLNAGAILLLVWLRR